MEVHHRTNWRRVIQWNRGWLSFMDTGRDKFDRELTHETGPVPIAAAAFCERLFVVSVLGVCCWAQSDGMWELCGSETVHRWIYKHKQLPILMSRVMTMCSFHVTDWIHIKCVLTFILVVSVLFYSVIIEWDICYPQFWLCRSQYPDLYNLWPIGN